MKILWKIKRRSPPPDCTEKFLHLLGHSPLFISAFYSISEKRYKKSPDRLNEAQWADVYKAASSWASLE